MFGKVFRCALLAAVFLTALTRYEEAIEFSPWCSQRVPVKLILMVPRPSPCKRHRRFNSSRLYLTLLLLLLSGDIELNPGPALHHKDEDITQSTRATCPNNNCDSCGMSLECLTLRSRPITGTVIKCAKEHCDMFLHKQCRTGDIGDTNSDWTCSMHSMTDACIQRGPDAPEPVFEQNTQPPAMPPAADKTPSKTTDPASESPPGPSFLSVSLMDVMESVRLTQLKLDSLAKDLDQVKRLLRQLHPQSSQEVASPTRLDPTDSDERPPAGSAGHRQPPAAPRSPPGEQRGGLHGRAAECQHIPPDRSQSLLVIGDSNVRRLHTSNDRSNTKFHAIPGGTTEHVAQDIKQTISRCNATRVVIHIGTNDITRKGSEGVAKSILDVAQQAKNHGEVRQVFVCSVTPRKDMGSFIFSRSESVNNRLRSLCSKTDIKFIDLREKLEVCKFNGLFRMLFTTTRLGLLRP